MKNNELREEIAKKIADAVQKGTPPWRQPWGNTKPCQPMAPPLLPRNFITNKRYTGVNPLLLMMACEVHNLTSPFWGTYKQWSEIGAHVRSRPCHVPNGQWGTSIVYWNIIEKEKENPVVPTDDKEKFMFMKTYFVFNLDQVSAPDVDYLLEAKIDVQKDIAKKVLSRKIVKMTKEVAEEIRLTVEKRLEQYRLVTPVVAPYDETNDYPEAQTLIDATGAKIRHGGDRAFYKHDPGDYIQLPHKSDFDTPSAYYETAYHELVHWAENPKRVGQSARHKGHRGEPYAFSELVAEIGACYMAGEIGLAVHEGMLPRSQSYVSHWLKSMGNEPKYIFEAATQAGKVVDYILQLHEVQSCSTPKSTKESKNSSYNAVALSP